VAGESVVLQPIVAIDMGRPPPTTGDGKERTAAVRFTQSHATVANKLMAVGPLNVLRP
jgi:hypothetical protein